MPRSLSPLARLALPFVVRDPGEPTGGAAPEGDPEPDAFEAMMAEGDNPLDFGDGAPSPFEGAGADEDERPAAGEGSAAPAAPALPEKVGVDGTDVPLADLMDAYRGREAAASLKESGETYDNMVAALFAGPEGAAEVVRVIVGKVREIYGDEAAAKAVGVPASLPEEFDAEAATPNERALVAQNAALQRKIEEMQAEFGRTLDDLMPVVRDRALQQAGDAHAATVNAKVPGAKATAAQIVAMMREHGTDDPVKAYKLATYDEKAVVSATGREEPRSTMPRGAGAPKTFDPRDPTLTVDRMVYLMEQGHTPITGK